MTAETSILLDSKENALSVPYDCVGEDSAGNYYVMAASGEAGEEGVIPTKKVAVTKGLETDYYTEIISDALKEGDEVLSLEDDTSETEATESSELGGGRPGGGGPGGGGPH